MDVLTERTNRLALDEDDHYEDDEAQDEDDDRARMSLQKNRRSLLSHSNNNNSNNNKSSNLLSRRRRRRSSARFLQLHDPRQVRDDDDDDDKTSSFGDGTEDDCSVLPFPSMQDLGQVYQNAIRMNAENKITASNSWNLNLIDHMDRFLGKPTTTGSASTGTNGSKASMTSSTTTTTMMEDTLGPITGVNFTKASCTLDASVKIYSYRVDDVHLTSYKVLANLNRTTTDQHPQDGGRKNKDKDNKGNGSPSTTTAGEGDDEPAREQRRGGARNNNDSTLETNLGTLSFIPIMG
jgi:condensin complex subunit 2